MCSRGFFSRTPRFTNQHNVYCSYCFRQYRNWSVLVRIFYRGVCCVWTPTFIRASKCVFLRSYRKRHLWSTYEKGMFMPSEDAPSCFCLSLLPCINLGLGICYDLEVCVFAAQAYFLFFLHACIPLFDIGAYSNGHFSSFQTLPTSMQDVAFR